MLPGSPQKARRRRLINGVKGAFSNKTYAAIQESTNNSRDVRKQMIRSTPSSHNSTTVFQPTFDTEEHGYRINVAKDGSMITAVPIHNDNNLQQRSAATTKSDNIIAGRRQESPILYSDIRPNASIHQSQSTQALLDARGNQRQKMKRARAPTKSVQHKTLAPNSASAGGKSPTRLARDQLEKIKEFIPTFPKSPDRQAVQNQSTSKRERRSSKVTWDLDEPQSTLQQSNVQKNATIDDEISFGSFPILTNHDFGEDLAGKNAAVEAKQTQNINASEKTENGNESFEASLQRRMQEIKCQQADLQKTMSHKDLMKGTLISAFDQNLEKNQQQMAFLEEELETIRWHLSLENEKQEHDKIGSEKEMVGNSADNQGKDPIPDSDSFGDPSITADTDSVADLFGNGKARQKLRKGMDPPARPSPSPPTDEESFGDTSYNQERKHARGSRVPTNGKSQPRGGIHVERPLPLYPASSASEKQAKEPRLNKSSKKSVHFNIPRESQEATFDNDSVDNLAVEPLNDFADDDDDFSWQGEHFDVDMYDDESGGLISNEGHQVYQWEDNEHNVVTSENYVRKNDQHRDFNERQAQRNGFNGSRGVSSASVDSDLDLSFVHAVAAVVIQTAVRRFLAELVAEERRYAVQVIQSAVFCWMDRRFSQLEPSSHYGYAAPLSRNTRAPPGRTVPQQRTKRVMFKDEYEDVSNFAATEIQRCFRGWLTRDTLEVDDFAATTIQRVFRGWWTRETMEVDRFCATEIQRIVRGHLCRMNYIYDLYCITVAQSVCRRFIAFNNSAVRLANVLYIQAIYRGYRVRSNLSRYVDEGQEVACTLIQTQWRSYDAQMNYINTLADILIVQSVARRWLTLRRQDVKNWYLNKRQHLDSVKYGRKQHMMGSSSSVVRSRNDAHQVWKEHRLKVVAKKKHIHTNMPEAFNDILSDDGVEDIGWYGKNSSETNDILRAFRGRKSN